ncbi:MAG: hypothetical protein OXU81_09680, partial [Gammaproteobacteria bacterium]|nr:hypothetical protein [Gammaproteobacteria bacterium]
NAVAVMQDDAAGEPIAGGPFEAYQSLEVLGVRGGPALTSIPTTRSGERSRTRSTSSRSLSW